MRVLHEGPCRSRQLSAHRTGVDGLHPRRVGAIGLSGPSRVPLLRGTSSRARAMRYAFAMPLSPVPADPEAAVAAAPAVRATRAPLSAWIELTKPRITVLLLITCAAGMVVAAGGLPSLQTVLAACIGFALASGGASACNHAYDRDIDVLMKRTASRPVVTGVIGHREATAFGVALMLAGTAVLWTWATPLSAVLALGGGLFYAVVYTVMLKRHTVQNIVIGGAAGAAPPLVGWSAVTGDLAPAAVVMFLVVFLWTPPHFWALAMLVRDEYARARVPMLPVVHGDRATARQVLIYTLVLLVASVAPVGAGWFGPLYGVAALLLGGRFVWYALRLDRIARAGESGDATADEVAAIARRTFLFSLLYLAGIFAAMVVDALVRAA